MNEKKSSLSQMKISVIILNWNAYEITVDAVSSVLAHTEESVEVILVDNGSDPRVLRGLSSKFSDTRVQIVEIGVNRFFGEGNNIGAEFASGEYLVFLNNDVVVTPGWLEPLVMELYQNPEVGAVGPKFIYPDGRLQEAGAFLDSEGFSVQRGKGQDADLPLFNSRKEVHYVSAACVALRKRDFIKVGGFNFIYEPAYYEDTDLCFSLRAIGLSVLYQPDSVVIHKESQTTSNPSTIAILGGAVETNRQKFLNRWGDGAVPANLIQESSNSTGPSISKSKTVVLFTPFDLIFGGGEKYILSVASAYVKLGFRTVLATKHKYSKIRLKSLGVSFGLDLDKVELTLLSDLDFQIDIFITMGNEVYPPTNPIGIVNIHHCQFPFPSHETTDTEIARLSLVDFVVVNSEFTKSNYLNVAHRLGYKDIQVIVISPPVSDFSKADVVRKEQQIVSVGRFFLGGHTKNQDNLIKAFSRLLQIHPNASLALVGGLASGAVNRAYLDYCRELAADLPVSFHIDADPDELQGLVQSSSVYWHGAGFQIDPTSSPELCEHFGISLVEAMGAGNIPVVVGNGGPDEIVEFGVDGFKYQSLDGLVRRTSIIFDLDSGSLGTLRNNARSKFERYHSADFDRCWTSIT